MRAWRRQAFDIFGVGEFWADPAPESVERTWLERKAVELNRSMSSADVNFYLTRTLLGALVDAGGGLEYSVGRLIDALMETERWAAAYAPERPPNAPPLGLVTEDVIIAGFELANILSWGRAMEERLERTLPVSKQRTARYDRLLEPEPLFVVIEPPADTLPLTCVDRALAYVVRDIDPGAQRPLAFPH